MRNGMTVLLAATATAAAALAATACVEGAPTETRKRTLQVGKYGYVNDQHGAGTFRVTYSGNDSIAVVWSVPNWQPGGILGNYHVDAYVLNGRSVGQPAQTYTHRIWWEGENIRCTGRVEFGNRFACTVAYIGD